MHSIIGNDWDDVLEDVFGSAAFCSLYDYVNELYEREKIYPAKEDIFNALKLTSYTDTKVVIIGQDPYFRPRQAHGLAFSVLPETPIPPSLMNIFKEVQMECGGYIPNNGCLIPWAKQGVLLLNSVLTVKDGRPLSCAGIGWEDFTDQILIVLNHKAESLIFMLWGNYAKRKVYFIDEEYHLVLKAAHPSPMARGAFFGCNHFITANQYLYETQTHTIDWQISNI